MGDSQTGETDKHGATANGVCILGHRTKAMECPACHDSRDPAWWKWYRGRTTSKAIRAQLDARLATFTGDGDE